MGRMAYGMWRVLVITLHRALGPSHRRSLALLGVALVAIPLWQSTFMRRLHNLDGTYRITAARGIADQDVSGFFYFFRHLGLYPVAISAERPDYNSRYYPVASLAVPADDSKEGARRHIVQDGSRLIMDSRWTFRAGDRGKIFLFYPDALIRGTTRNLSVRPFHQLLFITGLCALFFAFWWVRQPLLGVLLVLFLGSNPFQVYEVYVNENIFGLSISTVIWILAFHIPLMGRRAPPRYMWVVPFLTGMFLATVRTIRPDPTTIILSAGATFLLLTGVSWRRRVALVGLLVVSFGVTAAAWNAYFTAKFERARQVVVEAGGYPYPGPVWLYHSIWHPIWCGLGDFDKKNGYVWEDRTAYSYALPILQEKYHVDVPVLQPGHYFLDAYWDEAKVYAKLPEELPHYADVLREKILRDISNDPQWYTGIIGNRIWRILSQTTPVQIAIRPWRLTLPMHGLVFPLLLGVLIASRNWMFCKLICFSLPLSFTSLVIYSGQGTPYYSCYHLFTAAVLLVLLLQGSHWWWRRAKA